MLFTRATRCRYNDGSSTSTLAQHCTHIGWESCRSTCFLHEQWTKGVKAAVIQQTRGIHPMLKQHWVHAPCFPVKWGGGGGVTPAWGELEDRTARGSLSLSERQAANYPPSVQSVMTAVNKTASSQSNLSFSSQSHCWCEEKQVFRALEIGCSNDWLLWQFTYDSNQSAILFLQSLVVCLQIFHGLQHKTHHISGEKNVNRSKVRMISY